MSEERKRNLEDKEETIVKKRKLIDKNDIDENIKDLNLGNLDKKSFEENNMSDNEKQNTNSEENSSNIKEKISKNDPLKKKQNKKNTGDNTHNCIELNISEIADFISTHIDDKKNKGKNKIANKPIKKIPTNSGKKEIDNKPTNLTKLSGKHTKKNSTTIEHKNKLEVLDIEDTDDENDPDYVEMNINSEDDDDLYSEEELEYLKKLSEEERKKLKELEKEIENVKHDEVPERIRLLKLSLPIHIRHNILRRYDQLSMMDVTDNEYFKLNRWMDGILDLPFGKYIDMPISSNNSKKDIREFLYNIYNTLNNSIYGHNYAKNRIVQIVAQWISNPQSRGSIIALQGPPGIGKTSLIKDGVAKALGRPFHFIALGGATDASTLEGHNYTYEGAMWGRIAGILMESKCMNPVIFFDELDKVSETKDGDEIIGILTHLTDQTQNSQIFDRYFAGIPLDLSRALIVFSFNDEEKINPILKDRLTVIHLKGFDEEQKINIAKNYLLPELISNIGLGKNDVVFSDEVMKYIIRNMTEEDGVRSLKRCIESILLKLNVIRYLQCSCENLEKLDEQINMLPNNLVIKSPNDEGLHIERNHNMLPHKINDFKIPFILNNEHVRELLKDQSEQSDNISKNMMYI
jgi:ATP-dependent Lon protease